MVHLYWGGTVVPSLQWQLEAQLLPRILFSGVEWKSLVPVNLVPIRAVEGRELSPLGQPTGRRSLAGPFPWPNTQGTLAQTSYPNTNLGVAVSGQSLTGFVSFGFPVRPVTGFILALGGLPVS